MRYGNELLWITLPFVIGLVGLYFIPAPQLSLVIIILFWFWVGKRFARLNMSKIRSFAFGNSVWGICLLIFIWQYLLDSNPLRIKTLEVLSLSYISPFYIITKALPPLWYLSHFTLTTTIINLSLVGYFLMFAVFVLGFTWGTFRRVAS